VGKVPNGEPIFNYESLIAFLKEVKSNKILHTSKSLMENFNEFIKVIDYKMFVASVKLVSMRVDIVSNRVKDDSLVSIVPINELPQSNRQSRWFLSSRLANDITKDYEISPEDFLLRTDLKYRPNSCLATCVLYFIFKEDNSQKPNFLEGKAFIRRLPRTYVNRIDELGFHPNEPSYELVAAARC
jgi:hypothetical protein